MTAPLRATTDTPSAHRPSDRQVARDISYAFSAQTRAGRTLIRLVENATGRLGLIRRARGYRDEMAGGRDLWDVLVSRYQLCLNVLAGSLDDIPRAGPLILIANHPYGILDGLMMGHLLSALRGDFRIIAHRVFRRAEDLQRAILPISFDETPEALALNLATRREALGYLAAGGAVGIFPGGTVSTSPRPFGRPMDPEWRGFTARMVQKSGAAVVPIWFEGQNSRLFQLASHLHSTLRMALLIKEFRARVGTPVNVAIGRPIPPQRMEPHFGDSRALMDFLRAETYALAPAPLPSLAYGYEFEPRYRCRRTQR